MAHAILGKKAEAACRSFRSLDVFPMSQLIGRYDVFEILRKCDKFSAKKQQKKKDLLFVDNKDSNAATCGPSNHFI